MGGGGVYATYLSCIHRRTREGAAGGGGLQPLK